MSTFKYIFVVFSFFCYYIGAQESQICPETGLDYLPHYSNCSRFFECDDAVKTIMSCPSDYIWSFWAKKCVYHLYIECFYTTLTPPTTTTEKPTPGECPRGGESYSPDATDCTVFYYCQSGSITKKQCHEGYAWDVTLQACDLIENVDCSYISTETTPISTAKTTRTTATVPTTNPTTESTTYPTSTVETTTTEPTTAWVDPICMNDDPTKPTYHPHPYNCSWFYECRYGISRLMTCGDGYMFDAAKRVCDPADTVDCSYTSVMPSSTTSVDNLVEQSCEGEPNGTKLPYPQDIKMYIVCVESVSFIYTCPKRSLWNTEIQSCIADSEIK